jgi:hypothetical protein
MHNILASKGTKQYADHSFAQQASSACEMDMKHGAAPQGQYQDLSESKKKDTALAEPATPL